MDINQNLYNCNGAKVNKLVNIFTRFGVMFYSSFLQEYVYHISNQQEPNKPVHWPVKPPLYPQAE